MTVIRMHFAQVQNVRLKDRVIVLQLLVQERNDSHKFLALHSQCKILLRLTYPVYAYRSAKISAADC